MYGSYARRYRSARPCLRSGSSTTSHRQRCTLPPAGAWAATSMQSRISCRGTGRSRSSRRRTARVVVSSLSVWARSNGASTTPTVRRAPPARWRGAGALGERDASRPSCHDPPVRLTDRRTRRAARPPQAVASSSSLAALALAGVQQRHCVADGVGDAAVEPAANQHYADEQPTRARPPTTADRRHQHAPRPRTSAPTTTTTTVAATTTAAPTPDRFAEPGPYPVGVTTVTLPKGPTVEVWYPAAAPSDATTGYDVRDFVPPAIRSALTGDVPTTVTYPGQRDARDRRRPVPARRVQPRLLRLPHPVELPHRAPRLVGDDRRRSRARQPRPGQRARRHGLGRPGRRRGRRVAHHRSAACAR